MERGRVEDFAVRKRLEGIYSLHAPGLTPAILGARKNM